MKIESKQLTNDLMKKTLKMIEFAEGYNTLTETELNRRPAENKWSILECIEHINLYGDFYINEIENRIINAEHKTQTYHKTGLLGNYAANSMLPKGDEITMKMKTFKHMNPFKSDLPVTVIDKFIKQQKHYLALLKKAEDISLTKTKCSLTISKIKLRLGDALRFYSFHNVRHIVQANKILGKQSSF